MPTLAKIGWGAAFHFHDGTALFEAGEVFGIGLPDPVTDTVEGTHFKSADAVREYIAGLIEPGEGEIELNYVPGTNTDTKARAWRASRQVRSVKFVIPTTTGVWEVTTSALCTNVGREVPIDDRMTCTIGLKFSGVPTEAAGA